jgi:hypothetical protein
MTTSTKKLGTSWEQITDGIEDYSVHLQEVMGNSIAEITLSDDTPDDSTPKFSITKGEGISSITHPGKVWAKTKQGNLVILVINK